MLTQTLKILSQVTKPYIYNIYIRVYMICFIIFTETQNPLCLEAYRIKSSFFNFNTLSEICRRLVSHYFLLTDDDLQCWDSDPEEYSKSYNSNSITFNSTL